MPLCRVVYYFSSVLGIMGLLSITYFSLARMQPLNSVTERIFSRRLLWLFGFSFLAVPIAISVYYLTGNHSLYFSVHAIITDSIGSCIGMFLVLSGVYAIKNRQRNKIELVS